MGQLIWVFEVILGAVSARFKKQTNRSTIDSTYYFVNVGTDTPIFQILPTKAYLKQKKIT